MHTINATNKRLQQIVELDYPFDHWFGNIYITPLAVTGKAAVKKITLVNSAISINRADNSTHFLPLDSLIFHFDTKGKLVTSISYNKGVLTEEKEIVYDGKGKLISSRIVQYFGGRSVTYIKFSYSKDGNLVEEAIFDSRERLAARVVYSLDEKGCPKQKVRFSDDGKVVELQNLQYSQSGYRTVFEKYERGKKRKGIRYVYDKKGRLASLLDSTFSDNSQWGYLGLRDTAIRGRRLQYGSNDRLMSDIEVVDMISWKRQKNSLSGSNNASSNTNTYTDVLSNDDLYHFVKDSSSVNDTVVYSYRFDACRNPIVVEWVFDHKKFDTRYSYKYDINCNWSEARMHPHVGDGELLTRKIEYY